uniref:(northern house mosquito) hypothetical protein n=1 Tax=Culex pipiens TaxID=7175 RepID=A0A8D8J2Y6_CULPI
MKTFVSLIGFDQQSGNLFFSPFLGLLSFGRHLRPCDPAQPGAVRVYGRPIQWTLWRSNPVVNEADCSSHPEPSRRFSSQASHSGFAERLHRFQDRRNVHRIQQ